MIAVVSLLYVFLSVAEAVQEQPTLAARLSKAGLQFFSNIGHKIVRTYDREADINSSRIVKSAKTRM